MKNLTLLIICLTCLFSCDRYVNVEKAELQKIFKDIMAADSIKPGFYLIGNVDEWDTFELTVSDTTYKPAAADIVKDGLWSYQLFGDAKVISDKEYREIKKDPSKGPAYYQFSLPFFCKDKQSFYIYYTHNNLILPPIKQLRLYRKMNGTWVMCEDSYVSEPAK